MSARRLAALALLALATSSARAQIDFDTARSFPAAGDGECLALADVDEDGQLDVIVRGGHGLLVHWVRDPFATPTPPVEWAVPGTLRRLAVGDVDADGHMDVVVAFGTASSTRSLGVSFGDGRGGATFAFADVVGGDIEALALLDADGDSLLDIAAAMRSIPSLPSLVLVRQSSPRTFRHAMPLPSPAERLATGDFNGDGFADLVAGGHVLSLLTGDGAAVFSVSRTFPVQFRVQAVAAGDVDRDGYDDVVFTSGGRLSSLRGEALAGLVPGWAGPGAPSSAEVAIGDLDADGDLDLATSRPTVTTWWRNDGTGRFAVEATAPVSRDDESVAIGDMDGDGVGDVVGARPNGLAVEALWRDASGAFELPQALVGSMLGFGAAADLNGDGTVDLVFSGSAGTSGRLLFFFGDGSGGFFPVGDAALRRRPGRVVAVDLMGDSLPELLLTGESSGWPVTVLRNDAGSFTDLGDVSVSISIADIGVGDFDGDGAADFAAANSGGVSFTFGFGNGAGSFVTGGVSVGSRQSGIATGDLDADGWDDVAIATLDPPGVVLAFGNGDRSFFVAAPIALGTEPRGLVIGDVDRDGNPDVVVGDGKESVVRVLFGDGGRRIARTLAVETPMPAGTLSYGDATGDGIPDLLVTHPSLGAFSLLRVDGLAGFLPASALFHVPGGVQQAFATDVGEDGVPEVVVPGIRASGSLFRQRETPLAAALRGTVDARHGPARDVLFVNSRSGGSARSVFLRATDPLAVTITRPPLSIGVAPFAMYAWLAVPTPATVRALPRGLGSFALPMPLAPGSPGPVPREIWNTIGGTARLGAPTRPSSPAPTTFVSAPNGAGRAMRFTLQGIIVDPGAPNGRAAVTNGVVVEVR